MFKQIVDRDAAGFDPSVFTNIKTEQFRLDFSMQITAAVLLYNRGQKLKSRIWQTSQAEIESSSFVDDMRFLQEDDGIDLLIVMIHERQFDLATIQNMFDKNCKRLQDVELFLDPVMKSLIYCDEENKKTIVFMVGCGMVQYHLLQSVFPRLLPWLFADKPVTKEEYEYLEAFTKTDFDNYLEKLANLVKVNGIINNIGMLKIQQLYSKVRENQLKDVQQCIVNCRQEIDSYIARIEIANTRIQEYNDRAYALENKPDETFKEISKLFSSNGNFELRRTDNSAFVFTVKNVLMNFPDTYEAIAANKDSCMYYNVELSPNNPFNENSNRKLLMDAIFKTEEIKLKLYGCFKFDAFSNNIRAADEVEYTNISSYMPNPHLYYFQCLGGYSSAMARAIKNGNIYDSFMLCLASVGSINISEMPTFRKFCFELFKKTNRKCFILPDGTEVTSIEALKWIVDRRQDNEQTD